MAKHRKGNRRVADWMDGNKPIGWEKTLEGAIPLRPESLLDQKGVARSLQNSLRGVCCRCP